MQIGAIVATAVNLLLLTFFILSSLQTPMTGRRFYPFGRALRTDSHPEVALPRQTVQPAESSFRLGAASEVSYFLPWIRQDFQRWSSSGISWVRPCCPLCLGLLGPADTQSLELPKVTPTWQLSTSAVQEMVEEMSRRYRECFGEVFRFQIMNGTLWVDHISERHQGWYPSKLGAGELAAC